MGYKKNATKQKAQQMGLRKAGVSGKNRTKLGEETSRNMRTKLKQQFKDKDDEEILSVESADEGNNQKRHAKLLNDPFLDAADEDVKETAEEKRLRLTKKIIEDVGADKTDFFDTLQAKTQLEESIMEKGDDALTRRMKMHLLEQKGKLFYKLAEDFAGNSAFEDDQEIVTPDDHFEKHFMKGHKQAITCLNWTIDNKAVITGSKDCSLIKWDLESQKKLFFRGDKFNREHQGHYDEVVCSAISPNGKYLVSGGKDRIVRVWDIHNQKQIQTFMGHRDTITDITFDRENDQFYTVSNDRALKVWNLREMAFMDTHYGHHSDILGLDSYSKDRVISCSLDRQVIFWKIDQDSELLYNNPLHSVDTVNVINNQHFITSSIENAMDLWIMNKKKPFFSLEGLHQEGAWILSTANVKNSDLWCSGSYDGQVVIYGLAKDQNSFGVLGRIKGLPGCINAMKFSNARSVDLLNKNTHLSLAVTHSKEEKMGRWHVQPKVKTGISIVTQRRSNS